MEILLGPARTPVTVIGFVSRHDVLRPGIAVGRTGRRGARCCRPTVPDEQLGDDVFQALVVQTANDANIPPTSPTAIDAATGDATEALTITEAVDAIPGVEQQRQTFNQIIGVTVAIGSSSSPCSSPCSRSSGSACTGCSRRSARAAARCSPASSLQAVVVTAVAVGRSPAALPCSSMPAIPPGSIPLDITPGRIVTSAVLLLVAAVVGCAFSLRRVLRVDPASAIGTLS